MQVGRGPFWYAPVSLQDGHYDGNGGDDDEEGKDVLARGDAPSYDNCCLELVTLCFREGCRKKTYFLWSFANPGEGGVSEGSEKTILLFEKVFFQRACRIILVPPKHVLHLVWSLYVIYTAIRTALKVACKARILGKRRSISKNKKI